MSFHKIFCQEATKALNFRKAKFNQLRDAPNLIDWDSVLITKNTDTKWDIFKSILHFQYERYIPYFNKRVRNRNKPERINKNVMGAKSNKKKAFQLL